MIRLGLSEEEKISLIEAYLRKNKEITNVIVFSSEKRHLECEYEQYLWADIIMYKVFYPLLERIDKNYLIVVNELLRNSNRNELTYNCLHHYLNQTEHRIIYEYYPIINEKKDIMILLDNENIGRYKKQGYTKEKLKDIDIAGKNRLPEIKIKEIEIPEIAYKKYVEEREKLFENLGNKDPITIPNQLSIWSGKWKKGSIEAGKEYIARNARFKLPNVKTYKEARTKNNVIIDMPIKRLDLNDYLYRTKTEIIEYLSTPLKIDKYYEKELQEWNEKVGEIYVEAGIHK